MPFCVEMYAFHALIVKRFEVLKVLYKITIIIRERERERERERAFKHKYGILLALCSLLFFITCSECKHRF